MIGQIVGNYKIEAKLGEGGMGAVYRGVDTMLDREVAIKALRPELASQTSVVERFRSEAVTLAKLNHPNIAALYTMFRQGEELYMVLEFVRGETLDTIMQRRGALPAEEAIPVFCQVLDGIDHAHELGIVHRDIKPANIMLTENGKLKVLDFGIARLLGSARMTRAGNIIGTLEYMAPEQVKGQETDGRSDIYALGMMLYEMLTGRLPFQTENEFELMKLQTETMPPSPREINPAIPVEVEEAIMRAIQKNPDERFQTAGEMRDLLLEAGFGTHGKMHGITGTHKRPQTHPSRPPISGAGVSNPGIAAQTGNDSVAKATRLGAPNPPPSAANEPKATRLGASAATADASSANAMKATRLGAVGQPTNAPQNASVNAANGSFFSKLRPVHYIGAGVAVLLLMGVVVAVPLMFFAGKALTTEKKAVETPKVEEAQRPAVGEIPPQQQPQQPDQTQAAAAPPLTPVASPSDAPTLNAQQPSGDDLKPVENKPSQKPVAQKPAEKTAPVAQKPAAPKPPKQKPQQQKPDARCLLTGDC
ncbi:MAG TPA: serine/threonine-protein kinase [Pyrinomonadaceae bacterium]